MKHTQFFLGLLTAGFLLSGAWVSAQTLSQATLTRAQSQLQPIRRPTIWYVNAGFVGASNGRSWASPFSDLQDALAVAYSGDQVWAAAGSYYPVQPGGAQGQTFFVPSGVAVYGGFNGSEAMLSQRNPELNATILSGDINRDDTTFPSFNIHTGNSWNIVTMDGADASTRLDGFDVRTGHLQFAPFERRVGAGVRLINSSSTIANCKFSNCVAERGGAVDSVNGDLVVMNCSFTNNWASAYSSFGGALRNLDGVLTVRDCSFSGNDAESLGGHAYGGAIYTENGSTYVERCTFTGNEALPRSNGNVDLSYGGALFSFSGLTRVTDSTFSGNFSNVGGAVANNAFGAANTELINSIFLANHAVPTFLLGGTEAGAAVGAIYSGNVGVMDIIGCLVYGCSADNYGGVFVGGAGLVSGSIFWSNTDGRGQIGVSQVKAHRVRYSCVMNMLVGEPGEDPPEPHKFPGSIDMDPNFTDLAQGNYHLQAGSPCIDAGDNTAWPMFVTTDFAGGVRFLDDPSVVDTGVGPAPIVDMGPFERN